MWRQKTSLSKGSKQKFATLMITWLDSQPRGFRKVAPGCAHGSQRALLGFFMKSRESRQDESAKFSSATKVLRSRRQRSEWAKKRPLAAAALADRSLTVRLEPSLVEDRRDVGRERAKDDGRCSPSPAAAAAVCSSEDDDWSRAIEHVAEGGGGCFTVASGNFPIASWNDNGESARILLSKSNRAYYGNKFNRHRSIASLFQIHRRKKRSFQRSVRMRNSEIEAIEEKQSGRRDVF